MSQGLQLSRLHISTRIAAALLYIAEGETESYWWFLTIALFEAESETLQSDRRFFAPESQFSFYFLFFGSFGLNTWQNTPINFASSLHVSFPRNSKTSVQVYMKNYVWKSYVLIFVKLFTFSTCNSAGISSISRQIFIGWKNFRVEAVHRGQGSPHVTLNSDGFRFN
jgi:hypothetical protein